MQLDNAFSIAKQLYDFLQPYCDKIIIAGSIRRECPEVKDIELVLLPKLIELQDLFGNREQVKRDPSFIQALTYIGARVKGHPETGRYLQYEVNGTDMTLDMFIPQAHDYYRQVAMRTGSSDYSFKRIATSWKAKGWCGTPDGLRLIKECVENKQGDKSVWKCVSKTPTLPPAWASEEEFFTWLALPFINPKYRV